MKIFVEEEYGYRRWEWIPHVNHKCALQEFWDQIDEKQFADIFQDITLLGGMWREIPESEEVSRDKYDGYAHVHELHDSYLSTEKPRV